MTNKKTEKNLEQLRKRVTTLGKSNEVQVEKDRQDEARPQGWEPGAVWDGKEGKGTLTTDTLEEAPGDWDAILRERGLNPDLYEVATDTIKWCSYDGWGKDEDGETYSKICYSFRADIRLRKHLRDVDNPDLMEMYKQAKKAKLPKKIPDGESTFVVALADWQVGNNDGGGVDAQVISLAGLSEKIENRVKQLRKSGVNIGTIALVGMGDLYENCTGFYRHQEFTVEIDMRTQERIIRQAIFDLVETVAKLAKRVIVGAVGGNHGENRTNTNRYTTTKGDNTDVSVFEQVYDMCAQNPDAFGHIDWRIPDQDLAISMELSGHIVAFTHGHVARSKGSAMQTMWAWWEKQAYGRFYPGVADAEFLFVGHYHHFNVKEQLKRVIFIAPSLTDVSDYYGDSQGVITSPGTLTVVLDTDGWSNLQVLK